MTRADTTAPGDYFDDLYAQDDPFGYRDRWYEARKRDLLLACLPSPRFATAWEIGCSNGEFTAALADRCDALLATDLSEKAVALAVARTCGFRQVRVEQAVHPGQWPGGQFDLIVLSEVGYYLSAADLGECAARIAGSLTPAGVFVACHWRRPFAESLQSGDEVHRSLSEQLPLHPMLEYADSDILLQAWSAAPLSVAQREGIA